MYITIPIIGILLIAVTVLTYLHFFNVDKDEDKACSMVPITSFQKEILSALLRDPYGYHLLREQLQKPPLQQLLPEDKTYAQFLIAVGIYMGAMRYFIYRPGQYANTGIMQEYEDLFTDMVTFYSKDVIEHVYGTHLNYNNDHVLVMQDSKRSTAEYYPWYCKPTLDLLQELYANIPSNDRRDYTALPGINVKEWDWDGPKEKAKVILDRLQLLDEVITMMVDRNGITVETLDISLERVNAFLPDVYLKNDNVRRIPFNKTRGNHNE